jgi:hypothetical protein
MKKTPLLVIILIAVLSSCNNKKTGNTSQSEGKSPNECVDMCEKLRLAHVSFDSAQQAKSKLIKERLEKDSSLLSKFLSFKYDSMKLTESGKHMIDTKDIHEILARLYISHYKSTTPSTVQVGERNINRTESVWIDKEAIWTFAYTLLYNSDLDGIRVYFTEYPMNSSQYDPDVLADDVGRKSILFTATQKVQNGQEIIHRDYFNSSGSLLIYNYNSLCPDKCAGASLGDY